MLLHLSRLRLSSATLSIGEGFETTGGMQMKTLSQHYKETFGCKVYKLSLDGGFSCPNRDGTLGTGGCIFCSGSGEFAEGGPDPIALQLERAKLRVNRKNKDGKYMAYFQAFTNTYAPVERLRTLYYAAIAPEEIVGLSIGTRPDCLGDDVVQLLADRKSTRLNSSHPRISRMPSSA